MKLIISPSTLWEKFKLICMRDKAFDLLAAELSNSNICHSLPYVLDAYCIKLTAVIFNELGGLGYITLFFLSHSNSPTHVPSTDHA